ncbi:hypothetical protein J6590_063961 [Homalodisca vitripennis]|nr:hypothetical protein J6590_063961 [Homalodisca vitripennis]
MIFSTENLIAEVGVWFEGKIKSKSLVEAIELFNEKMRHILHAVLFLICNETSYPIMIHQSNAPKARDVFYPIMPSIVEKSKTSIIITSIRDFSLTAFSYFVETLMNKFKSFTLKIYLLSPILYSPLICCNVVFFVLQN